MKKIAFFFCILSFSFTAMANQTDADKIYKKLKENNKEAFSISLSKNMIDFFDMDLDFNGKEKLITGDFHEGKMLVLNELKSSKEVTRLFKDEKYKLVEFEDDDNKGKNDDKEETYLFVDRKGNNVSEAHFVIINEDSIVVLSVFGDIKVKNK